MPLDQRHRVLNDVERGQPQKIHLEKRQLLQAHHVVLRDNFVFAGLVERNQLAQRHRRNHHARRVHRRRCAPSPPALHATSSTSLRRGSLRASFLNGAAPACMASFSLMLSVSGDQLGDAIHVGEADIEHAAHVFDRRARAQRAEGDDLRHLLAPVFLGDVLDHFAAPARAEIDVDIGHADALRIQEALEQQPVFQRIDVGDLHRVTHQAAGGRSAARAHGNAARFREADEIPDDQEIARELHLLDHAGSRDPGARRIRPDRASIRLRCAAPPVGRAAFRIPAGRRIRNSCRWCARRERRTSGTAPSPFPASPGSAARCPRCGPARLPLRRTAPSFRRAS